MEVHRCSAICQRGEEVLGIVESIRGQKICLDTAPIIYFIEDHEKYRDIIRPIFIAIDSGNVEAISLLVY